MTQNSGVFLYYLPRVSAATINRKTVLATPIAPAFSDAIKSERTWQDLVSSSDVAVGPDGSSGTILAIVPTNWTNSHKIGFHADEQTWRNCGEFWLGHSTACVPGPSTLQRQTLVSGYEVELGDGNVYFAPTIRRWNEDRIANNLPLAITWNEKGECLGETVPALRWAWELSGELWNFRVAGIGSMTVAEYNAKAVQCLSLNYRVGVHEVSMLGLMTSENADEIVNAAIDQPLVQEYLDAEAAKKNQSAAEP